jgi:hypothetical protein
MMRKANKSIFDYELVKVARLWLKRIRFSESFVVALALRPAGVGTISMIQNNRYCDKSCGTIETIAKFCYLFRYTIVLFELSMVSRLSKEIQTHRIDAEKSGCGQIRQMI